MGVLVYDEHLLVHAWEELFVPVRAIVFQELHELSLVDQIEESDRFFIFDLFRYLDYDVILLSYNFIDRCR